MIRGERLTSIGHLASYMLFLAFAMFFIISGFITHELVRTFHFALIPACFAYFLCSMNPLRDFTATLSDTSTTTLAPEGITFHMAHHLSVNADLESASSGCGSDASFRWDQNVKIYDLSTASYHVDLLADPDTYDGPWGLCEPVNFSVYGGLEVGGDSVGVGGGELGEGLFPVGGGVSLDEACGGCSFVGGFACVCEALGGSFVFDVADGEP